jgi:serine/threonine-protein kinase
VDRGNIGDWQLVWQGKQLGNYRLEELIGKGGFGEVYRATELGLERSVAVKVLIGPEDISDNVRVKLLERFSQEARLIASLEHYNILPIFAYSQHEGIPYLVMPLMEKSLAQRLKEANGRLPFERVIYYTRQVCTGLQYAHDRNIIHRDIKPPNILLSRDESRVVLADFGIARILSNVSEYTNTSVVIGSPLYMAPEQQGGTIGKRTDIYSLGLTVYELLTGFLPREHIYKPLVPPSRLRGDIPPVIDPIFMRATAKDPDERFATALEFLNALDGALASVGFHQVKTAPAPHSGIDTATQAVPPRSTNPNRTDALPGYPPTPNPPSPSTYGAVPSATPPPIYTLPTVNITPNPVTPNQAKPDSDIPGQGQVNPVAPATEEKKPERKRGIYFSCSVVLGAFFALAAAVTLLILATAGSNNSITGDSTSVAVVATPTQVMDVQPVTVAGGVPATTPSSQPPTVQAALLPESTPTPARNPTPILAPTNLPVVAQPSPTPRTFAVLGFAMLNRNTDSPNPSDSVNAAYVNTPLYLFIQVGGQTQPEDLIIKGLPGGDVPVQVQPGQNAFVFPLEQGLPSGSYRITLLFLGQETGYVVELSVSEAPPSPTPAPVRATTAPVIQTTQPPIQTTPPVVITTAPPRPLGTIVVQVLSSAGRPLSGVRVSISGSGGTVSGVSASGSYSVQMPEGNYTVTVACTGGNRQASTRAISGGTINVTINCP